MTPKHVKMAGMVGGAFGAVSLLILALFIGVKNFRLVIALPFALALTFPILGACASMIAVYRFDPYRFGAMQGAVAATLAFILFALFHAVLASVYALLRMKSPHELLIGPSIFLADLMFGTLLVGWAAPIIGAGAGAIYKRRTENAP